MLHSHEEHDEVNDEEQHSRDFEDERPAIVLVVLEQLIKIVTRDLGKSVRSDRFFEQIGIISCTL
jgi:hypothetical protein